MFYHWDDRLYIVWFWICFGYGGCWYENKKWDDILLTSGIDNPSCFLSKKIFGDDSSKRGIGSHFNTCKDAML